MERRPLALLVFSAQIIGFVFFAVFLAAFYVPLPSNDTLIGDPNFRTPMTIFGLIFIALTVISIVTAYVIKRKD